jgi:two-component system sensor histidine kinase DesK
MFGKFEIFPKKLGYFPYLWLLYISMPIIYMTQEQGLKAVCGYIMIGVFIFTYRQLYFVEGRPSFSYLLALQMLIILILTLFYSPYNMFMGFFSSNFIGWHTDKFKFKVSIIALMIIETLPIIINMGNISPKEYLFLIPFIIIMLATPFGMRSMKKHQNLELQLDQANEHIKQLIKREERMRISRDLHDTLGHTLSLITLKSQLVEKLVDKNPTRARLEAKEIERTSRAALKQVRELVSDMRAVTLTEELIEVKVILQSAHIGLAVEGNIKLAGIPDLTQNILSMCLREAITNIVKHSQASSCTIHIEQLEAKIMLTVQDNGIGCDVDNHSLQGNGLKGMRERLSLIEGSVVLSSNKGTTLTITSPIVIKEKEEETA